MTDQEQKRPSLLKRLTDWLHTSASRCALIFLITAAALALIVLLTSAPKRYSLEVGTVSEYTVAATKDVEDRVATEAARERAANAVAATWCIDKTNIPNVLSRINATFNELRAVQQYGASLRTEEDPEHEFTDREVNSLTTRINGKLLSQDQRRALLAMSAEEFDAIAKTVTDHVGEMLGTGVQSNSSKVDDAAAMISSVYEPELDETFRQMLADVRLLPNALEPYWELDEDTTQQARDTARASVDAIMYKAGQTIVRSGDLVNANQLEMIRSLGLLAEGTIDFSIYYGGVLITALSMVALLILLRLTWRKLLGDTHKTTVVCVILVLSAALCAAALKVGNAFMVPVLTACMLATALLSWRAGLPVLICSTGIAAGLAAGNGATTQTEAICLLLMTVIGGSFAVLLLWRHSQRMRVLLCSLLIAVINGLVILSMSLMTSMDTSNLLVSMLWAASGAILAGVLTIAIQPIFESVFNLPTSAKLMELSNPNHPLLRRLLLEAPGTYHHSIIVANLAEAAAEAIGAHPLLARTGAYFHDIGKLARPQFFKENQEDENPLNQLEPHAAAQIVTAHTRDGVTLAQKYRLPPEIQRIIAEHHGDTPVMYFYNKAIEESLQGQRPDIRDFRYAGPRPHSKEAAIVMLSDTAEAAVRSIKNPTPQQVRENIDRLVRGKLDDGQLSECPLTMRDISGICEAFAKVLAGVFHERIEYPKTAIPKRGAFMNGTEAPAAPAAEPAPSKLFTVPSALAGDEDKDYGIWGKPPDDLFSEDQQHENHLAN